MRYFTLIVLLLYGVNLKAQEVFWVHKITVQYTEPSQQTPVLPTSVHNLNGVRDGQRPGESHPVILNRITADIHNPIKISGVLILHDNTCNEIAKITIEDTSAVKHRFSSGTFSVHTGVDHRTVLILFQDPLRIPAQSITVDLYLTDDPRTHSVEAMGLVTDRGNDINQLLSLVPQPAQKEYIAINNITKYAPVFYGAAERLSSEINSMYTESKPLISPHGNRLFFVRKNAPANYAGVKDAQDIYYSDFYNGTWSRAVNMGYPLNDRFPNGVCAISPDGNTMLVLNAYRLGKSKKVDNGVSVSRKTYNGWTAPVEQYISGFHNLCPYEDYYISNSGDVLLLALQCDDSYGDQDIYVAYKTGEHRWSRPVNLGRSINSDRAEFSPHLSPDNKVLYFASTGHGGYGESDVFYALRKGHTWTEWTEPVNLGAQVNTPAWDAYFSVSPQMDYGYFISSGGAVNRAINHPGDADIYRIKLREMAEKGPEIVVHGRLINIRTNQPVGGDVLISSEDGYQKELRSIADFKDGFALRLDAGKKYTLTAEASGYLEASVVQDFSDIRHYTEIKHDIFISPIEAGSTFKIDDLFFARSKAEILPESVPELEKLVNMLIEEPSLRIELGGHTDNQGSYQANLRLSQERASAVMEYLVTHGIKPGRISAVGYGSSKPIADNQELAMRSLNRRVEVKVLSF